MRVRVLCLVVAAFGPAAVGLAGAPKYTVAVSAPHRSYHNVPVSVEVPLSPSPADRGNLRVTDAKTGESLAAQLVEAGGKVTAWWIIPDLPQGTSRRYRLTFAPGAPPEHQGVRLEQRPNDVEVTIDGQLFTRYCFGGGPKPYCYPLIGPTGAPLTRAYPMASVPGEPLDHPHQRSFWFTHGEVNGIDFWSEGPGKGRQQHLGFDALQAGPVLGLVRARNDWVTAEGKRVCRDVRELRVYDVPEARLFDFAITIQASDGPVEFGDTKEGMLGVRVARTLQLAGGQGHILNSAGQKDGDAWGKPAEWCDYSGPVSGQTVGITIFDDPHNLRHPTYWHVRDYGLFAANPFGLKDFTNAPAGAGKYTLPADAELTFRYRFLLHRGSGAEAGLPDAYAQYADPPVMELRGH